MSERIGDSSDPKILLLIGRDKGLALLNLFLRRKIRPFHAFVMREDPHETNQFADQIIDLLQREQIDHTASNTVAKSDYVDEIKNLSPDIAFVCGWRTIIPGSLLPVAKLGWIAAHEALLPKYRGFAPINWAIRNGEKHSGVTLFYLDEGTDSGDIIDQTRIPIGDDDTSWTIYEKTTEATIKMVDTHLNSLLNGTAPRKKQNHAMATYTCALSEKDGEIDWQWPTRKIHNLVRATTQPFPGAFTYLDNKKLTIWESQLVLPSRIFSGNIPGRVVGLRKNQGVEVLTSDGQVLITRVQLEGGDITTADRLVKSIRTSFGYDYRK